MSDTGDLPPRTVEWVDDGEWVGSRAAYRRMLGGVGTHWRWHVEVRCPIDGYLRWDCSIKPRSVPYWVWRGVLLAVKVRVYARVAVLEKCPQCKFWLERGQWSQR